MTNFEHYKEEIKNMLNGNELHLFVSEHGCDRFDGYGITKWYLAEYVEPYKFTQFEKDVLENLDKKIKYICKNGQSGFIWVRTNKEYSCFALNDMFQNVKLDCLEWDKKYKISDILANCEVVD